VGGVKDGVGYAGDGLRWGNNGDDLEIDDAEHVVIPVTNSKEVNDGADNARGEYDKVEGGRYDKVVDTALDSKEEDRNGLMKDNYKEKKWRAKKLKKIKKAKRAKLRKRAEIEYDHRHASHKRY
jgi:hypothetical protein